MPDLNCQNCASIVRVFLTALLNKSKGLFHHSIYTSVVAARISRGLGMSEDAVSKIIYAALLHDIGKLHLPDSILLQDSTLTKPEYEMVKLHPQWGAAFLIKAGVFSHITELVLSHHELPDGSGYPSGLKVEGIPVEAGVIGIADKYSAMTMKRVYRDAYPQGIAIDEIHGHIRGFFNGNSKAVVSALIKVLPSMDIAFAMKAEENFGVVMDFLAKHYKEDSVGLGNI